ncbi:TPA: hypothetical protein ACH3X1_012173 [Trebouxia sp. C0004]
MTEGGEECDMFKEFVVSKEDLQSPRSSPVNAGADCDCDPDLGSQLSPKLGSQSSPAVTTVCNGLTAGMDLTCLVDESGQVNISAPPLSPSVDGSDSHSPTSSFTFAGWETPDAGQCPDGRNEDSEHDDAQSVLPQTQPHVPAACPEGCFEQQQAANSASVGKLGSPLPVSPSRTVDQEASVDLSLKLESEYTACNSSPDDFSPLQLSLTQQLDMSDSMREGEACMTPSADAKGHGAAGLQINLNQIQQLSNSLHTSVSGLDAANASDMAAQPGSAHHMQNRSLGGFLSPLGKLAGMFGWAPGKSAEHFNAMPVSGVPPVANSNRDRDGHSQSDEARSANSSSAAEPSEGGRPVITKELSSMATSDAIYVRQKHGFKHAGDYDKARTKINACP